jgi:hypothetical protein
MSTEAQNDKIELLQGTLDMPILRTLLFGPADGHAIAHAIEHGSEYVLPPVAYAGIAFFSRIEVPSDLPIKIAVQLDPRVLWVRLAASLPSAILFGLSPALQTTRPNLVNTLRTAGSDTPDGKRLFGRNALVVGQVAASMVLWFATAAMSHEFRSALTEGLGFRTDHLLMMSFNPGLVHYADAQVQPTRSRWAPIRMARQLSLRAINSCKGKKAPMCCAIRWTRTISTPWPCRSFEAGRSL